MEMEGEIPFDELKEIVEHAVTPNFEEIKRGRAKLSVADFCDLWLKALRLENTCYRKIEEFKYPKKKKDTKKEVSWFLDCSIHCGGDTEIKKLYKSFLTEPLIKIWDLFYARREGLSFLIFDGEACIREFSRSEPETWIILKAETFKKGEPYINLVLYHELAHYLLFFTDVNSLESQKRQEAEADFLAATWALSPSL